jgi:branched-chain amino acid transport system substrate-binding protein
MKLLKNMFVIVVLLSSAACSRQTDVKIGVVVPLSGVMAPSGKSIVQGAQIAIDELNESKLVINEKRVHFSLLVEDDKGTPEDAKAAAGRLVSAGVVAVYGHLNSSLSILAAPIYAKAKIPQMSASTNPKFTRMDLPSVFRIAADDIEQGATLGRIAVDKLRAKRVFIVDDGGTYGVGLVAEVDKVLAQKKLAKQSESLTTKDPDYQQLVKEIIDYRSDVVIYGGDEQAGLALLKALRATSLDVKFVTGDSICDAQAIRAATGSANDNFFCTAAGVPPSWLSAGLDFVQRYRSLFGEPGANSPLAYDGIHVFAQAMQRANSVDPLNFLPKMKNVAFDGKVQGPLEFDSKGDLKEGAIVIFEAIGGKLVEQLKRF